MNFVLLSLFFLTVLSESSPSDAVFTLNSANFDALTAKGAWIVEFYAPWCKHCKDLAPEFEKAAVELNGVVKLGKVDATVERNIAKAYKVEGYPTLVFIREGESRAFRGQRNKKGIVDFAREMTAPPVVKVTMEDWDRVINDSPVAFVHFGEDEQAKLIFHQIAKKMQGEALFLHSSDETLKTLVNEPHSSEDFVLLVTEGVSDTFYSGPFDINTLRDFVEMRKLPLVVELSGHNFGEIVDSEKPAVIFAVDMKTYDKSSEFHLNLLKIAYEFKKEYQFCILDGVRWRTWLEKLEASTALPSLVIFNGQTEQFYLPEPSHPIDTYEGIQLFLWQIQNGKVKARGDGYWSPRKMYERFDVMLSSNFSETQLLIGGSVLVILVFALLVSLVCCLTEDEETPKDMKPKKE